MIYEVQVGQYARSGKFIAAIRRVVESSMGAYELKSHMEAMYKGLAVTVESVGAIEVISKAPVPETRAPETDKVTQYLTGMTYSLLKPPFEDLYAKTKAARKNFETLKKQLVEAVCKFVEEKPFVRYASTDSMEIDFVNNLIKCRSIELEYKILEKTISEQWEGEEPHDSV